MTAIGPHNLQFNGSDIDSVEKGMSAKVYVAFPVGEGHKNFYLAYDADGSYDGVPEGFIYVSESN